MQDFAQSYLGEAGTRFGVNALTQIVVALLTVHLLSGTWRLKRAPFWCAAIGLLGASYALGSIVVFYVIRGSQSAENAVPALIAMITFGVIKAFLVGQVVAARCRDYTDKWKMHASIICVLFVAHILAIFIGGFRPSKPNDEEELADCFA